MPVTVALNAIEPPGWIVAADGVTETVTTSAVTFTVAVSFLEGSATLVATTW